jgi:hypothetical protein
LPLEAASLEFGGITVEVWILGHITQHLRKPLRSLRNIAAFIEDLAFGRVEQPANILTVVDLPEPFGPR